MDQWSSSKTLEFKYSLIDDVIANVVHDFHDEGADPLALQQLKAMWRSKMHQASAVVPTTPMPNKARNSGSIETKRDAAKAGRSGSISGSSSSKVKERALSKVSAGGFPLKIKWVWQPIKVPQIPLPLRSSSNRLKLRGKMAVARPKNLSTARQLDGGLSPIEEEDESSDDEPEDLQFGVEAKRELLDDDGASLNSDDDPIEEDATDEASFQAENVIICHFDKISRIRNKWKFQLSNGIMYINGKGYVFKECSGRASW